jgi:hypothetical protein
MTPAENLNIRTSWYGDTYNVSVEGEMRESRVGGPRLTLHRSIGTSLHSRELRIHDRIANEEPEPREFMFLYHFNFGYPLLDADSRLLVPRGSVKARTPGAEPGLDRSLSFEKPVDGADEECYFYDCRTDGEGHSYAALVNDKLELAAWLRYDKGVLPVLTQWKNPRSHDYAMGIEPGNSYLMGRKLERENGTLLSLPGYGSIEYDLTLGILEGAKEIGSFEGYLGGL